MQIFLQDLKCGLPLLNAGCRYIDYPRSRQSSIGLEISRSNTTGRVDPLSIELSRRPAVFVSNGFRNFLFKYLALEQYSIVD
jgi:hypothetical protein